MPPGSDRHLPFHGPVNFRDLGGYAGQDGRTVKWGLVFRADALLLDDRDIEPFARLGIRTVYDLRSSMERDANPNRLPDDPAPATRILPLVSEDPAANPLEGINTSDGEGFLEQLYLHIFERSATNFGQLLTGLADLEQLPAVFHCAAGKDRTGLVSAALLSVLGVNLDDILDDYELTSQYRTTEHVQASMERLRAQQSLPPEVIAGMLRAPRPAMFAAVDQILDKYGDFDSYLTGPAGAAADIPDRLRELLLED